MMSVLVFAESNQTILHPCTASINRSLTNLRSPVVSSRLLEFTVKIVRNWNTTTKQFMAEDRVKGDRLLFQPLDNQKA